MFKGHQRRRNNVTTTTPPAIVCIPVRWPELIPAPSTRLCFPPHDSIVRDITATANEHTSASHNSSCPCPVARFDEPYLLVPAGSGKTPLHAGPYQLPRHLQLSAASRAL